MDTYSQKKSVRWFTDADGLPAQYINDIEQGSDGTIYLTSHLGLIAYNGKDFKVKTSNDGLPNSSVGELIKDNNDRIWVTSFSKKISYLYHDKIYQLEEYNKADYKLTGWKNTYFVSDDELIIDQMHPLKILHYKRSNNDVWVKVKEDYREKENRIVFRNPDNPKEITCFFDYRHYLSTKTIRLEFENKKVFELKPDNYLSKISMLNTTRNQYFSVSNHLFEISKEGVKTHKIFNKTINEIYVGTDNTLWVTYIDGGTQQIDKNTFATIGLPILNEYKIYNFLHDMEGGIWFSTSNGLAYLPYSGYEKMTLENHFASTVNTTFIINDTMYIGHQNGNVGYIILGRPDKEKIVYTSAYLGTFHESYVRDFTIDNQGYLLFNNNVNGIYRMNRSTYQVEKIYDKGSSTFLNTGDKVLATLYRNGVLEIYKNTVSENETLKQLVNPVNVEEIYMPSNNEYLLGCMDGLWKLKDSSLVYLGNKKNRLNERISGFVPINPKYLAIATYGSGLTLCSGTDTILLNTENGLISNFVNKLKPDSENRLWVLTSNGICIISFLDKQNIRKIKIDYIPGYECINYENYTAQEYKNTMYITSEEGVMIVRDKKIAPAKKTAPLVLYNVWYDSKPVSKDTVIFHYTQDKPLSIDFRLNNFNAAREIKYYYRLKNYSDKWLSTINESVTYQTFEPGEYQFEVYAYLPYTGQKSNVQKVVIKVLPLFWQTAWFKILCIIILAGSIYLLFRQRIESIKQKEKKKLESQLMIAGMESKALRAQMNPHFIFNTISAVQSVIFKNDLMSANYFLTKFSKLIRSILEFSIYETIPLYKEIDMLTAYMELERFRLNNKFDFHIVVDTTIDTEKYQIPSMLLQPIVENAIIHGLMPLENNTGSIHLHFKEYTDGLKIIITDNGIGREMSAKLKLKKEEQHTSLAIKILEDRLRVYNFISAKKAAVEIKDKINPTGTEVIVTLPLMMQS